MIQRIFFSLLRNYVKLGLRFYFKEIKVVGRERIPEGAVIFTPNHQNAFMDALLLICFTNLRIHSLVRASVFKNPIANKILRWLYMMPVFRIRDGFSSLSGNDKVFNECFSLLNKQESLLIFPEGNHNAKRQMPPLSKGFARVAFGALEYGAWQNSLHIQPVTFNYSAHTRSGSRVSMRFGEPIAVHSLRESYLDNPQATIRTLKEDLSDKISAEMVIIPEPYEQNELLLQNTLGDRITDPAITQQLFAKGKVNSPPGNQSTLQEFVCQIGYLINIIPITILRKIIASYVPDPMFHASLKVGIGIFLFPIVYGFEGFILDQLFDINKGLVWLVSIVGLLLRNKARYIQTSHAETLLSPVLPQNP